MEENWMARRMARRVTKGLMIALMVAAAFALFSYIVMELWNWLVPPIFGWRHIGYWQAVGLFVLSKLLFGGFRGGHGHRGRWSRRMRERWEQMTPEQREKFRKGMMCGCMASEPTATEPIGNRAVES